MNAVDTNILLYVHDPRDARKQAIAESLVQSLASGALLWQVACEYVAASRKLTAFGFGPQDAWKTCVFWKRCGPLFCRVGITFQYAKD